MAGGLNTIGLAALTGLAGYALVRFGKRLFDQPRDDLSDGFGLDDYIPSRASPPFARSTGGAAVSLSGGPASFSFWDLPDDEGLTVHTYFDGSVHGDEK